MTLQQIQDHTQQYLMKTPGRLPIAFVRGRGARLWDSEGKEYLDFLSGIAVCGAGHCHPHLTQAIARQAEVLMHTSNLYLNGPQAELARRLSECSGGYLSFFANSGAEAVEGAIKLARKHAKTKVAPERFEIIAMNGSFHGRTYGAVTATGTPRYHENFGPMLPGVKHIPFNEVAALEAAVTGETAAILTELVQGESGVHPATPEFVAAIERLRQDRQLLLIVDEVQTGLGRTGKTFSFEHYGVRPDIFTLAKTLAGGFPMGAVLATPEVAATFVPGDHASTFGGNYLACAAAHAYLDIMEREQLAENAAAVGAYFHEKLNGLKADFPFVSLVRGKGLMQAVVLSEPRAKLIQERCLANGLVVNAINDTTFRFLPPLNINTAEVDEAMGKLRQSMTEA